MVRHDTHCQRQYETVWMICFHFPEKTYKDNLSSDTRVTGLSHADEIVTMNERSCIFFGQFLFVNGRKFYQFSGNDFLMSFATPNP